MKILNWFRRNKKLIAKDLLLPDNFSLKPGAIINEYHPLTPNIDSAWRKKMRDKSEINAARMRDDYHATVAALNMPTSDSFFGGGTISHSHNADTDSLSFSGGGGGESSGAGASGSWDDSSSSSSSDSGSSGNND